MSPYRTVYNLLRNPQSRGKLQDEGYQLLALLQIPAWVAVQHLHRAWPRSAPADPWHILRSQALRIGPSPS